MRRTTLLSALLSAAFVLTSCTALYYPGDDYLNGPADAAPSPGADANDGAAADAAIDSGALVCPPDALYCDDFERSDVQGKSWDPAGNVTIDTTHAHSPTRALLATTVSGGDPPNVEQPALVVGPRTKLDVWFYTPTAPQDGQGTNFRIAQMLWGDACDWDLTWELVLSADDGVYLNASAYDKNMNANCGPIADQQPPTLLSPAQAFTNRWHHVVVIGDVSKQERQVEVQIDDSGTFSSVTVHGSRSTVPTSTNVAVGIPCIRTDGGCFKYTGPEYKVWIDDLIIAPAD